MNIVVLTGSEGPLGGRVGDRLALDPTVDTVVRLGPDWPRELTELAGASLGVSG